MPSTTLLPISEPRPDTSNPTSQSQTLTPAFRVFISHLSDSARRTLSKQRPWPELFDHHAFSRPRSFPEAASRILKNASYFRVNYLALLASVIGFSLVSHPFALFCLALLVFAWMTLYFFRPPERSFVVGDRSLSRNEVLGLLSAATLVVMFFTSVGSVLVHATLVGVALVCVHGALRTPEDLFTDDQRQSGLFSVVNGVKLASALETAGAAAALRV